MKKSELKSYIKENVRATLSESVDDESAEYYFDYLNKLRDSGVTNMFGAGSYLQAQFGLDKQTARTILSKWMKSFSVKALKNITTEMKSLARKYSKADESEKEKIKDILRVKTPQKKELESLVAKLEKDVV